MARWASNRWQLMMEAMEACTAISSWDLAATQAAAEEDEDSVAVEEATIVRNEKMHEITGILTTRTRMTTTNESEDVAGRTYLAAIVVLGTLVVRVLAAIPRSCSRTLVATPGSCSQTTVTNRIMAVAAGIPIAVNSTMNTVKMVGTLSIRSGRTRGTGVDGVDKPRRI